MVTVKIYMINTIIILMCYFKIAIIKVNSNFLAVASKVFIDESSKNMYGGLLKEKKREFVDNYHSF